MGYSSISRAHVKIQEALLGPMGFQVPPLDEDECPERIRRLESNLNYSITTGKSLDEDTDSD